MKGVRKCTNCGAKLDPSAGSLMTLCELCASVNEREPPLATPAPAPAAHPPVRQERREKVPNRRVEGIFGLLFLGVAVLLVGGTAAYVYLTPQRDVVGAVLVVDVTGDGIEDVIAQWDEQVQGESTSRVGLIDGKSRKIVWSSAFPKKTYADPLPMALGDGYLALGDPKPVANLLNPKTGALEQTVDLPETATQIFADGASLWIDMHGKAMRVDARSGQKTVVNDSVLDPDRPTWAPYDAYQDCPQATCRHSSPMPIADMNVSYVYMDGQSDAAVAIGSKENGTLPMLAGISLDKQTVRWSHVLSGKDPQPPHEPVVSHDRVYFEYEDGAFQHLACMNVVTGELVWDVKSKENARRASDIAVASQVYVSRYGTLELHDAKTGAKVTNLL